jgi:hypothetical protein
VAALLRDWFGFCEEEGTRGRRWRWDDEVRRLVGRGRTWALMGRERWERPAGLEFSPPEDPFDHDMTFLSTRRPLPPRRLGHTTPFHSRISCAHGASRRLPRGGLIPPARPLASPHPAPRSALPPPPTPPSPAPREIWASISVSNGDGTVCRLHGIVVSRASIWVIITHSDVMSYIVFSNEPVTRQLDTRPCLPAIPQCRIKISTRFFGYASPAALGVMLSSN